MLGLELTACCNFSRRGKKQRKVNKHCCPVCEVTATHACRTKALTVLSFCSLPDHKPEHFSSRGVRGVLNFTCTFRFIRPAVRCGCCARTHHNSNSICSHPCSMVSIIGQQAAAASSRGTNDELPGLIGYHLSSRTLLCGGLWPRMSLSSLSLVWLEARVAVACASRFLTHAYILHRSPAWRHLTVTPLLNQIKDHGIRHLHYLWNNDSSCMHHLSYWWLSCRHKL